MFTSIQTQELMASSIVNHIYTEREPIYESLIKVLESSLGLILYTLSTQNMWTFAKRTNSCADVMEKLDT